MQIQKAELQGLEWVETTFSLEPRWTTDPDLDCIRRTIKTLLRSQEITVSFLSQGAFNKIYDVVTDSQALILRVSLPVDPRNKTLSEVATINWTQQHTSLPVPKVIAHESDRANPVGFEWILMEKLAGEPLANVWDNLGFPAKEQLVKQIARYYADVFSNQLRGIGNIYPDSLSPLQYDDPPAVKRIVSMQFFWGDHVLQDVPRGPFQTSAEWMRSYLSLLEHDCDTTLAKYEGTESTESDEDEIEDAMEIRHIIAKLKLFVDGCFPVCGQEPEPSVLIHDDMNQHNILVDKRGNLTGVVDWECVSASPLWKACAYPLFLEGRPREEAPDLTAYQEGAKEEPNGLYMRHLREYEQTKLRKCFREEMRRLEPRWVEVFDSTVQQRDFYLAAQNCDNEFCRKDIIRWIANVRNGEEKVPSLRDVLNRS
ncbi:phosphotransferase enzyme family-domain-containing protein [Nemania serpens]|nr:phosphotransferase enzyme family-domain-containing protein [Nemania serpens]